MTKKTKQNNIVDDDYNLFPKTKRGKLFLILVILFFIIFTIWFFMDVTNFMYVNSWEGRGNTVL